MKRSLSFKVVGEAASKSNSSRIVFIRGRPRLIKSAKALAFTESFKKQAKPAKRLLQGDVELTCHLYYKSRRPDLDESLVMDCLQGIAYKNDRQIKIKHIYHHLDRHNPRVECTITEL